MWPYTDITREEFDRIKDNAETIIVRLGGKKCDFKSTHNTETTSYNNGMNVVDRTPRPAFELNGTFCRVGENCCFTIPHIVIECGSYEDLKNNVLDDCEPFPYYLSEEDMALEISYSLGLLPYPRSDEKMTFSEVTQLLDSHSIGYDVRYIDNPAEYYKKRGFPNIRNCPPFTLIVISNPNHSKDIELSFTGCGDNPDLEEMSFGSYCHEMFSFTKRYVRNVLIDEIKNIMDGKVYVICAYNQKNGRLYFDGGFDDSVFEWKENMDEFRKAVEKIRAPKNTFSRLTGRTDRYEIFNWNSYEEVVK